MKLQSHGCWHYSFIQEKLQCQRVLALQFHQLEPSLNAD